jgi:hypothetical protein
MRVLTMVVSSSTMKKTLSILIGFASLTIANTGQARLGWTLDQCRQKYGTEQKILQDAVLGTPVYFFETPYFEIIAFMLEGRVGTIKYIAKPDLTYRAIGPDMAPGLPEPFSFYTQDVIDDIIRKNVGDQKLILDNSETFRTKDGTIIYISLPTRQYNKEHGPFIEFDSAERQKLKNLTDQQKAAVLTREIASEL